MIFCFYFYPLIICSLTRSHTHSLAHSLTMSSAKFTPFSAALKTAMSKINSIVSEMDKKMDSFADQVISVFVDYDENLIKNDEDREDLKQKIVSLFDMFQPEKKAPSTSGYNLYCKEERENVLKQNPGIAPTKVISVLGSQWKSLDQEEKDAYNAKAKSPASSPSKKPIAKKEKVKCEYEDCERCPKEPTAHTDGKIYCAKHLNKVILAESKSSPKTSPKSEKKSPSKKTEEKKTEKKSSSKKTEEKVSNKEKLEKKLEEANKKLKEKTKSAEEVKPIKVSPKTAPKTSPKKSTFDFTSEPKSISENIEFWTTKRINLNKNTEGKRWRYNPETGLCFEDNDDFVLAATYINGAVAWLGEIPEEVKEWAKKSGCELPDEDEDIELEGDFSDEE